jgi:hypothetical protein
VKGGPHAIRRKTCAIFLQRSFYNFAAWACRSQDWTSVEEQDSYQYTLKDNPLIAKDKPNAVLEPRRIILSVTDP